MVNKINIKKNLLVTLADENYIDQAKQLFSSVYWNAGWKGDYMLLSCEIPEKKLKWFKDKGFLIKRCKPVIKNADLYELAKLCKFYLFTSEFKKWKNIIYLDADIIIRSSLEDLTMVNGFAAVLEDLINNKLIDQFISPSKMGTKIFNEFKREYNLLAKAFNSGVIAFSTNIIKRNMFSNLKKLYKQHKKLMKTGIVDQPILNLFFYKRWKELQIIYNLDVRDFKFIKFDKIKATVFHLHIKNFLSISNSQFYNEWKFNFKKADNIDLRKIQPAKKFKQFEIKNYSRYLKISYTLCPKNWIHFVDYNFGLMGIFLYDKFPKLYFKLKKLKRK